MFVLVAAVVVHAALGHEMATIYYEEMKQSQYPGYDYPFYERRVPEANRTSLLTTTVEQAALHSLHYLLEPNTRPWNARMMEQKRHLAKRHRKINFPVGPWALIEFRPYYGTKYSTILHDAPTTAGLMHFPFTYMDRLQMISLMFTGKHVPNEEAALFFQKPDHFPQDADRKVYSTYTTASMRGDLVQNLNELTFVKLGNEITPNVQTLNYSFFFHTNAETERHPPHVLAFELDRDVWSTPGNLYDWAYAMSPGQLLGRIRVRDSLIGEVVLKERFISSSFGNWLLMPHTVYPRPGLHPKPPFWIQEDPLWRWKPDVESGVLSKRLRHMVAVGVERFAVCPFDPWPTIAGKYYADP